MSDLWSRTSISEAARIGTFSFPAHRAQTFTPWSAAFGPARRLEPEAGEMPAITEPAETVADAYSEGFDEGRRSVEMEVAAERDGIRRLAAALEVLRPEAPEALAALLAETVERLVRQIVGEVSIDGDILLERATRAAALVIEEATPTRMRLSPPDHARMAGADLPVEMVADPLLSPGTVLLETGGGWIEDGPEVGLEKLRVALDRMGVPR